MSGHKAFVLAILGAGLFLVAQVQAAPITWTGNAGTDFATAGNWSGGAAPVANDWQDTATFSENSPANRTPTLAANRSVGGINFSNSVGWTLSGAQFVLRTVQSSGSGSNTVSSILKTAPYDVTWTIGSGNTLVLTQAVYQDGGAKSLHITGGGTLNMASRIDGWASTNKVYVDNGLLKVAGTSPFVRSGNILYLTSLTSKLQLQNTLANVTNLINTNVIQSSVTGQGLYATSLGNGYVQVVVPEPATAALVSIAGVVGLAIRPRRRA